jgi:hypothetical protein
MVYHLQLNYFGIGLLRSSLHASSHDLASSSAFRVLTSHSGSIHLNDVHFMPSVCSHRFHSYNQWLTTLTFIRSDTGYRLPHSSIHRRPRLAPVQSYLKWTGNLSLHSFSLRSITITSRGPSVSDMELSESTPDTFKIHEYNLLTQIPKSRIPIN